MNHPYQTAGKAKAPPSASSSTATLVADSGFSESTSTLVADKRFSVSASTLVEEEIKKVFSSAFVEEEKEKCPPSASAPASTSDTGPQISAPLTPGTTIGAQELFDLLRRGYRIYVPKTSSSGDAEMRLSALGPSESRWSGYRRYRIVSAIPRADTPQLPNPWASVWVQAAECDEDQDSCRRTGLDEVDS